MQLRPSPSPARRLTAAAGECPGACRPPGLARRRPRPHAPPAARAMPASVAAVAAPPPPAPAAAGASADGNGAAADAVLSFTARRRPVVGASGDLAKKKIFPALFALFYEGSLPKRFTVMGFARSKMTDEEFRTLIGATLTCRVDQRETCGPKQAEFLTHCFYVAGSYDDPASFAALGGRMGEREGGPGEAANRIFYLSVPPSVFVAVAQNAARSAASPKGWTRVIVEKPFGRDLESSRALGRGLAEALTEDQVYRIDHYLGKELIENLTVLRFSNLVFQPLWNRDFVRNVQVIFSENFGTEGRGGYFDNYGIIRDIMQNHLTQVMALFAMEQPISLDAEDVRNEKVKLLRSIRPIGLEDVVLGQYAAHETADRRLPGYLDDATVPRGSLCPTFAAIAFHIDNPRWDGVPFLMKAGKALDKRFAEIRVQFRTVPGSLYAAYGTPEQLSNELVIRIQPDEGIVLRINNKVPGLGLTLDRSTLDLQYKARYKGKELPDAYERLILDVVNGDKRLFIRDDELEAAWKLFTPLLQQIETSRMQPELYPYSSKGPIGAHYLAARHGVRWGDEAP